MERLHLETLEERSLPNNLLGFGSGSDNDDLFKAASAASTFTILPQTARVGGEDYSKLSADWWQYAYSVPQDKSPWLDSTGANFAVNQSGKVWYLAGSFSTFDSSTGQGGGPASYDNPAVADRHVTLAKDKYLFFPILNSEWDNINLSAPTHRGDTHLTPNQLRDLTKAAADSVGNMSLTIDGVTLNYATLRDNFRTASPVFSYKIPDNSIYNFFGADVGARTVGPAVSDGYYVLLAPLPSGQHTINFTGAIPPQAPGDPGYAEDITYHINVPS